MNSLDKVRNSRVISWAFLMLAIVAEVIGTSFMTLAARDGGYSGYLIMALALAISYYFLALSIRKIGVGVAYAIWEGVGLVLLTIVGVYIFKDTLTTKEFTGLMIAIIGITCVTLGEEH
ncbi:SMR family transporter [Enterobacter cloacae complex sp. P32C]|uniref:SMR family transporter n=1 Tax=Enterobacter cloacae complex sp. P32C TaxID=2779559 RepID=UPI001D01528E|nr:SMR family transporter [Enterobacter cloacae complex sp. P32C]